MWVIQTRKSSGYTEDAVGSLESDKGALVNVPFRHLRTTVVPNGSKGTSILPTHVH